MTSSKRIDASSLSPTSKILVLIDGVRTSKLPPRTATLLKALAEIVSPVLIAESYQKPTRSIRRLSVPYEFYGFSAERYDADVKAFSFALKARYSPAAVLSYGWENAQLVYELARRQLPVVMFLDCPPPAPDALTNIKWSSQFADAVFFTEDLAQHFAFAGPPRFQEYRPSCSVRRRHFIPDVLGRQQERRQRDVAGHLVAVTRRTADRLAGRPHQARRDADVIRASKSFNVELFAEPGDNCAEDQIERYLFDSRRCIPRAQITAGRLLRRPVEGFHPLIYATQNAAFDEGAGEDPLAHYLRHDCPEGAWTHQVIRALPDEQYTTKLRAALHIHLHYPELLPDLLARLQINDAKPDLFITTTSDDRRDMISSMLSAEGVEPEALISDTLNRGRDIWPFIDLLRAGTFEPYGVVGHLHGKRSPANQNGDGWRDFLWRHLVGGPERTLDSIMFHFENNDDLGLVIPEDPHLESWGDNLDMCTALGVKMGISSPLPSHFDCPQGTMFWARPQALSPLLDIGLTKEMMPPEPLEVDGTILHAIERLVPFAVAKAKFRSAATYVPGSVW